MSHFFKSSVQIYVYFLCSDPARNGSESRTGFAAESGHERTFSFENLLRKRYLLTILSKTVRKGMFPTVFFLIFPPVRGSFFPPKMNVTPHFWPQKNHLTPGLRSYMGYGNVVLKCDVLWRKKISFFLSAVTVTMLSKRSSIEYMKLIFIKIYSETQERKS